MIWSDEDNATLFAMKEARKTNREIGDHFGVTEDAAAMQWGRMRSEKRKKMGDPSDRRGERWTDEENAALIEAGDKGEDWGEIGIRMHRPRWACKVQYNSLKRGAGRGAAKIANHVVVRQHVTALAKQIRDGRPQHQSITAEFFGDPLPGRSALDQRGQGDGVRSVSLAGVQR